MVEHCCSVTSLQLGETLPNISKDLDTYSYRLPLGVTAGITPFNFPAMIPLWMFPVAIVLGNTSVIKPSERDPGACMMLMELLNEAGCPPGVVNVIHGAREAVSFICDNPDIKAISFVGSDQAVRKCILFTLFFLTLREEYIFTDSENRVLRKIFEPKMRKVTGGWEKLRDTGYIICAFLKILLGNLMKNEISSVFILQEMLTKFLFENLKLGIGENIILRWILKIQYLRCILDSRGSWNSDQW